MRDGKEHRSREVWQERKSDCKGKKVSMCHYCLGDVGACVQGVMEGPQLRASKELGPQSYNRKEFEFSQ